MKPSLAKAKWLFAFTTVALLPPHLFAEVASQNFVDNNDLFYVVHGIGAGTSPGNIAPAQRFTASTGGFVDSISAFLAIEAANPLPLKIDIRTVKNDVPGAVLGSVISAAPLSVFQPTLARIDFTSANVRLTAGEDYFAVFSVAHTSPPNTDGYYYVWTMDPNLRSSGFSPIYSYDGGTGAYWYHSYPPYDQEIGLIVTVVPEPQSASQLIFGGSLIAIGFYPLRFRLHKISRI